MIEEFEAEELNEKCRRCQKLSVDNVELAVTVLEEKLQITEYDVPEEGVLRIFEHLEESGRINKELILGGVEVKESYLVGQDLEAYFMERLGE